MRRAGVLKKISVAATVEATYCIEFRGAYCFVLPGLNDPENSRCINESMVGSDWLRTASFLDKSCGRLIRGDATYERLLK